MCRVGETTKLRGVSSNGLAATRDNENSRILKRVGFDQARTKSNKTISQILKTWA